MTAVHSPRDRYTAVAQRCADVVIRQYSTSFGMASRLFTPATRPHVAAIYAWARAADEVVDGAIGERDDAQSLIEELRDRTDRALARGFDADPIVHAFADTARRFGIDARLVDPFYESMATDLRVTEHSPESLERYIHGSAEVIGEMCMRTFSGGGLGERPGMAEGARRLGAAFQKVNFLRDVNEDWHQLGRNYLPGRDPAALTDRDVAELADDVDSDLAVAGEAIARIPGRDRVAVLAAHDLFAELNRRLRAAGAAEVTAGRVRVPDAVKVRVVARAVATGARPERTPARTTP